MLADTDGKLIQEVGWGETPLKQPSNKTPQCKN